MNETLKVVGTDGHTLLDAVAMLSKKTNVVKELKRNNHIVEHVAVIGILHLLPEARGHQPCDPHGVCSLPSWCTRAGGLFPRFGNAKTTAVVIDRTDLVARCSITSAATLVSTSSVSSNKVANALRKRPPSWRKTALR